MTSSTSSSKPSKTTWRRVVVAVAALAGVLITFNLGLWQLSRAQEKLDRHQNIQSQQAAPVLDTPLLLQQPVLLKALHRRVSLTGYWLPQHTVYLDNRQMNAKVGFFVLTPLVLEGGGAIVVQRGWVPRNFEQRDQVPAVQTPGGVVDIEGRIVPLPSKLYEPGAPGTGLIRQNLDLDRFRSESGLALADFTIRQSGPASDGLRRDWPAVALGVEKHYGYAFQWFALAALIVGLYLWFHFFRRPTARFQETHPHVPPPNL